MMENPGSTAARRSGCKCPVIDNHHGAGRPTAEGLSFIMAQDCSMHGPAALSTTDRKDASDG